MSSAKINEVLKNREFISVATCDFEGVPNVAPKFLLKVEGNFIYLIDYIIGKTWENLKVNAKISLGIMNLENLTGYQINGEAQVIDCGVEFDKILDEFRERKTGLSAMRIIEGVEKGKRHSMFELAFPEQVVIFKVKVNEFVEIAPQGKLTREKIEK